MGGSVNLKKYGGLCYAGETAESGGVEVSGEGVGHRVT
jgi:hypothetical protein